MKTEREFFEEWHNKEYADNLEWDSKKAPEAGIEPATNALTVHRSTAELLRKAVG